MFWWNRNPKRPRKVKISIVNPGEIIMASAVTVLDSHAPLQLVAQYVNAKGVVVAAPATAQPAWSLTAGTTLATQVPSTFTDVVTLAGSDGSFTVSYTDGTFSDTLPVTVTPDQTPAGVSIVFLNP